MTFSLPFDEVQQILQFTCTRNSIIIIQANIFLFYITNLINSKGSLSGKNAEKSGCYMITVIHAHLLSYEIKLVLEKIMVGPLGDDNE